MISVITFTLFIGIAGFFTFWKMFMVGEEDKKGKKIPGPRGIPILGNVLQLAGDLQFKTFSKWSEKYGEVYKIYLGSKLTIIISDTKLIKEIMSDPAYSGRQIFQGLEMYAGEPLGLALTEGELWETHRRFLIRQLKDFGFGKSSTMDQLIASEAKEMVERLSTIQEREGRIKDIKHELLIADLNSLFTILAGKRYKQDDPEMLNMLELSAKIVKEVGERIIFVLLPWTKYFIPGIKDFDKFRMQYVQFYKNLVDERKKISTCVHTHAARLKCI